MLRQIPTRQANSSHEGRKKELNETVHMFVLAVVVRILIILIIIIFFC